MVIDFGEAAKEVPFSILKALSEKINNCASPLAYIEDTPTLQDPIAVMKQFFLFEMVFQENGFSHDLPKESLDEFENRLRYIRNLCNWAFYWLRQRTAKTEDMEISLNEFLSAIRSCWSIGDPFTLNLMADSIERPVSGFLE